MADGGRLDRWAAHPLGPALLFLFAVLEACVFPAPTEALLLALALARPERAWRLGALTVAGGAVGAGVGYWIGASFFHRLGAPVLAWYDLLPRFEALGALYRDHLFLALATSGYTPIPHLLYTIAAGAWGVSFFPFLAGAAVGRALKYGVMAALAWYFGPAVRAFLARHLRLAMVLVAVLIVVLVLVRG